MKFVQTKIFAPEALNEKKTQHRNVYSINIPSTVIYIGVWIIKKCNFRACSQSNNRMCQKKKRKKGKLKNPTKQQQQKFKKKRERKQSPRSQNNFWIVEFSNILFVRIKRIRNISSVQNNVIPQHGNHIK